MKTECKNQKKRVYIRTFGCQMNRYDSQRLLELLRPHHFEPVDDYRQADFIFINTCSVRDKAEQKALSYLGRLKTLKRRRPDLVIGMGGCVAQQYGEDLQRRMPHLDLVVGTHGIARVPELLGRYEDSGERQSFLDFSYDFGDEPRGRGEYLSRGVSAYVTIMRGCDNFCSYCIVPWVRGRENSRPSEEIVREIEGLVDNGVREVVLLGQNVNSYGKGLAGGTDFAGLLKQVARVEGLRRIRFTTSHPKDLSASLIRAFAEVEPLCPHIHLPVQSGSNSVLKMMNRSYTREHYLHLVEELRRAREDVAISSDIIVGFPGETQNDFQQTLDLLEEVRFDALFSFKYSDRPQTAARHLTDKVPEQVKLARLQTLQDRQARMTLELNQLQVGETLPVLVEGPSQTGNCQLSGRTPHNRVVNFEGSAGLVGEEVPVYVCAARAHSLLGVVSTRKSQVFEAVRETSCCGK